MNKLTDNTLKGLKQYFYKVLDSEMDSREIAIYFDRCCEVFLKINRADQVLAKSSLLSESEILQFLYAIKSFEKGVPLAYVLNNQFFYGLDFKVNSSVLIPRPETEELVDFIVKNHSSAKQMIDLGTGSGCIALALKSKLGKADVHAVDVSEDALSIAIENAVLNNLEVQFHSFDVLNLVTNTTFYAENEEWDVIVSNPPYIPMKEKSLMERNVLDYEPHLALFVPDNDPLIFYRKIGEWAITKLSPTGVLYFEIHEDLGGQTCQLLQGIGFNEIDLIKDMQGKDRIVAAGGKV